MQKTVWKSKEEIKYLLRSAQKVSILSCGICANLSNTGGKIGIRVLKELLKEWGKKVTMAKCVMGCCPEEIVRQAIRIYRKPISKSDALIILSCASGVKAAFLCKPEVPVVGLLDSVGSLLLTHQDNFISNSICISCGSCVINHTDGICPLPGCPEKKKYEPCEKFPTDDIKCPLEPSLECVWKEIEKRGDLAVLKYLSQLHGTGGERPLSPEVKPTPGFLRKLTGWVAVRAQFLVGPTRWVE
ncbi:MAG: methylenetetrahydrofolate reductase C-terminal domain-containing protein [Candidatus Aminicenantes bacterium]|nr:MAG: methylenetetrahydrofolate reductase C-terminal domain-containing protein [Candidatus Aminicenantes bacterium]